MFLVHCYGRGTLNKKKQLESHFRVFELLLLYIRLTLISLCLLYGTDAYRARDF